MTNSYLFTLSCSLGEMGDNFGWSVGGVGDVNDDGHADMMVSAYHSNASGADAGRIIIISGSSGAQLADFRGLKAGDELGCASACVGDLNGDGYSDIAVGAQSSDTMAVDCGAVNIYFLGDADGDGITYACDNCTSVDNPDQIDSDGDGIGDVCEYLCGDADGNGFVNISDAICVVFYSFGLGPAPDPVLSGDADCSQTVDISDAIYLITYIFSHGPGPCTSCR
jgi:hypothetical protein